MKKLFLLFALLLVVACSPEEDEDCGCEAVYSYEFILNSWADRDAYEDFPRSEAGNLIGELREPVPCGTNAENIDFYDVFGNTADMSSKIVGGTEELSVECN